MRRRLFLLWCLTVLMALATPTFAQRKTTTAKSPTFVEGKVRVKLQREVALKLQKADLPTENGVLKAKSAFLQTGITQMDAVGQKVKAVQMKRVFPYAGKFEERHKEFGLDLWYDITYDESSLTTTEVKNLYKAVEGVTEALRIPVYKIDGYPAYRTVSAAEAAHISGETRPTTMPFNDPLLSNQWHYNNTGTGQDAVMGADINLFRAWDTGIYGSKDVVVAIIDGGIGTSHPDLASALWVNEAELNGQPGVDDDNDGYVDDIYGFNFVINSSDVSEYEHGMHVAGTIGAVNNNGVGVCGIAGGSDGTGGVRLMQCQVYDSRSNQDADFAAALVYAADMGASIAQCSWGYSTADVHDEAIEAAVKYFTKNGGGDKMNGGLCIFSSGNTSDEGQYYPQCMSEVVAVAASTNSGEPAYYSTIGDWVDVTAPGGLQDYGESYGVLSTLPNDTYGYMEGTSMACPHVAGIAALILSKYGNAQFSNETLRTLLTTSVNALNYDNYPTYEGKVGTGLIDAYKALQGQEGSTPDAVGDYTLTASHDNILIEWIIPDTEEKSIDHHVIYYSTEPFTAESNLNSLNSQTVDTKFQESGDSVSYELTGLEANTTYYIAIVAYNRWGNASKVSEIKSATTNAGPKAKIDKYSISMSVDGSKTGIDTRTFNVSNTGEGILKYELSTATKKATYSTSARNTKVSPGNVVPFSGTMNAAAATKNTLVTADYETADYPRSMTWGKTLLAYLGEGDTSLPNAMAQYFTVDADSFPDGFNLTHLNFKGAYGENPTIEIYSGSRSISTATLLETVTYDTWSYYTDIALPEQIHFNAGAGFWVVAKFPAGQTNPLGAATADADNVSQYSYYSSDNGATWTQLSEVVKGGNFEKYADQMTWAITCKMKNPDWSQLLTLDPRTGEVRAGEKQLVTLSNDGQKVVNGTYNFTLHLSTNEATPSNLTLPVTMKVTGYKPELSSKKLIDFGSLIVGESKTITVELANTGYGPFGSSYLYSYNGGLSTSSDQFTLPSYASAVSARSTGTVDITFKPTQAGDVTSTITLDDKKGNTYSFLVRGVASEPAKLVVTPESYDFGDLDVDGAAQTATFTLKNDGKYPLQYVFPKFSDEKIEGTVTKSHKYGYTYIANFNGDDIQYEPAPELSDEVDITSQFNDNNWQSGEISLGFQFPFYGVNYDKVHVTSRGGIAMNTIQGTIGCMVGEASCMAGLGSISAWGSSGYLSADANSKISYGHRDGNFYVIFKDVISNGDDAEFKTSFHIMLSPDGSATFYYDDYDRWNAVYAGGLMYLGVVDEDLTDPFTITDNDIYWDNTDDPNPVYANISTGTVVKIVAPTTSMVTGVSSTDGYIGIGESKDITVTVKGNDQLNAGKLTNNLVLLTNDPENGSKNIVLTANITGANLKPEASTDSTAVDFGTVFRTSTQKRTVSLTNTGKDVLTITGITFSNSLFSTEDELSGGFSIAAGNGKDVTVSLNTATSQTASGTMTIAYSDGTTSVLTLKAHIIGAPTADVTPESIEETTPYGTNVAKTITIKNTGDETLTATVNPDSWFSVTDAVGGDNATVDYQYQSSIDGFDIAYDWEDITSNYDEHAGYSYYYDQTDYQEVQLPFEFPFYGKKYSTMYIYDTGFIRFDEPTFDYKEFPEPPGSLPTTSTFYSNIICPFWGNHSMGTSSASGAYYKADKDHATVSFINYGNSMMQGMNFQVLLYPDGTFKFQYNVDPDGMFIGVFGLTGIMDVTCTRGVNPSDRYVADGSAMLWKPVMSYSIAPGESVSVPVELLADQLADDYSYELTISTNDPQNETVVIPVAFHVTGEPNAVFPASLEIDEVVCTPDEYGGTDTYYKDFTVKNLGSKAFTIKNVESSLFDFNSSAGMSEAALMVDAAALGETGGDDWELGSVSTQASSVSWQVYSSNTDIVVGKDSVRFRIAAFNTGSVHTATGNITFYVEGLDQTKQTTALTINITEAPVMTFDKDSIVIKNADDSFQSTETMTIKNDGKYKLKYAFHLNADGTDEELQEDEEDEGGGVVPMVFAPAADSLRITASAFEGKLPKKAAKASGNDDEVYVWDMPSNFTGTNSLYYPALKPWTSMQAYYMGALNTTNEFEAATLFTAPAEGFNLTDLYYVGSVGSLTNVDVEAYVVKGTDPSKTDNIVTRGKLHIDKEGTSNQGFTPRTLTFNYPVYFNPGEQFYIVVKYPAGYAYNMLLASKDGEETTNRYMANGVDGIDGWFDIEEVMNGYYSTGACGYFMTALEQEPGEPWIKLLNATTEGEIAVGETLPVNFAVDASKTHVANQKATLVITSNDPEQPLVNYHIWLNRNAAPVITAKSNSYVAAEGTTTVMPVTVNDPDGDAFTVSLTDSKGIAAVNSYSPTDGVTETNGELSIPAGTTLTLYVGLTPDYGTAGKRSYVVTAVDEKGNENEQTISYTIEHVNRAPEYKGATEIALVNGGVSETFNFSQLFTDPDGDDMTYTVSVKNSRIATIYTSETGFIISATRIGTTTLTLTATDENGATTTQDVTLKVMTASGIDGVTIDGTRVSDVSSNGTATITFGEAADNVDLTIYNNGGQTLQSQHLSHVEAGQTVTIDLGHVPTGVYTLVNNTDGEMSIQKFIKK